MIKKYLIIVMYILMLTLTACDEYGEKSITDDTSMFEIVEGNSFSLWRVVYNKETKVMYAVSNGSYNAGTFTLLVNPDGSPMLWEKTEDKL